MTAQEVLEDAIVFAQELIDGPGDNPDYFASWRADRDRWKAHLEAGRFARGAEDAIARVKKVFVSAADAHEATADLGGLSSFTGILAACSQRLSRWRVFDREGS